MKKNSLKVICTLVILASLVVPSSAMIQPKKTYDVADAASGRF